MSIETGLNQRFDSGKGAKEQSINQRLANQFLTFSSFAQDENLLVVPYTDSQLPIFNALSIDEQHGIASLFEAYFQVMAEVKKDEGRLYRNLTAVWRMISAMRLVPSNDLFEIVRETDVVEIYDAQSRQVFRSFNFFPLCTYTLEQMYCIPWFKLYERDDKTHEQQMEFLRMLVSGEITKTFKTENQPQVVKESSLLRRCNKIQQRFLSPLYDRSGLYGGFVNAFEVLETWDERSLPTMPLV